MNHEESQHDNEENQVDTEEKQDDTTNPSQSPKKKRNRRRNKKKKKSDDSDDMPITSEGPAESKEDDNVVHLTMEQIHALFLNDNTIAAHLEALRSDRDKYLDQIRLFVRYSVIEQLTTSTKAKILCVLLIRNERDTAKWLMSLSQHFSVGEIARCIQLLDAPRKGTNSEDTLYRIFYFMFFEAIWFLHFFPLNFLWSF